MAAEMKREAARPDTAALAVSQPLEQEFNAGSLYALRSAVSAYAAAAGLSGHRLYDVTAAAHELAANAVLHGAGHGSLRLWAGDAYLCCAVADDGPAGNGDAPAAGTREAGGAGWPRVRGHGLWLVGEIADDVRVERGQRGTVITLRFATGPDGDGR
jgi:anti-sigma regulatory factor (Ser/Thr protein kinase)